MSEEKKELPIVPFEKPKSLIERVEELEGEKKEPKKKIMRLPRGAKVSKGKFKKGWVGVITIHENGVLSGEKTQIYDFTHKTKDNSYHATNGKEIGMWGGKFPVIIQPSWKLNPLLIRKDDKEVNETYGQKYIMARMLGDTIKVKGKMGGGIVIWIIAGIAAVIGINYFTGGSLF